MTHKEWEDGKELTIHNATKEQLKWMVKDRDKKIKEMYKDNQEKQKLIDYLISICNVPKIEYKTLMLWKEDFVNQNNWETILRVLNVPNDTTELELKTLVSVHRSWHRGQKEECVEEGYINDIYAEDYPIPDDE